MSAAVDNLCRIQKDLPSLHQAFKSATMARDFPQPFESSSCPVFCGRCASFTQGLSRSTLFRRTLMMLSTTEVILISLDACLGFFLLIILIAVVAVHHSCKGYLGAH